MRWRRAKGRLNFNYIHSSIITSTLPSSRRFMYLKIDSHKKLRELSAKTRGHPSLRTNIEARSIRHRSDSTGSEERRCAPRDESIETPRFSGKPCRSRYKWHRISTEIPTPLPNPSVRKQNAPPSPLGATNGVKQKFHSLYDGTSFGAISTSRTCLEQHSRPTPEELH